MKLTRRRTLLLLGLLSTGSIPVKALASAKPVAHDAIEQWLAELGYLDGDVMAMGREYLRTRPDEADLEHLTLSVCGDCPPRAANVRLREKVRQQVRDDYSAVRVVQVDGWLLAVTEARLYAIASLL